MQEDETLKIAIAETSVIIRSGVALLLKRIPGLKILPIEIISSESLEECLRLHHPDILIINPAFQGYFDVRKLKEDSRHMVMKYVALITTVADRSSLKDYDDMIELYDDPEVVREKLIRMLNIAEEDSEAISGQEILSVREKEIVTFVVKGMTNKEIADVLFLSTHTVITHRRNIARKLQIHSPAGLTIYAIVNKLIELQDIKDYL